MTLNLVICLHTKQQKAQTFKDLDLYYLWKDFKPKRRLPQLILEENPLKLKALNFAQLSGMTHYTMCNRLEGDVWLNSQPITIWALAYSNTSENKITENKNKNKKIVLVAGYLVITLP